MNISKTGNEVVNHLLIYTDIVLPLLISELRRLFLNWPVYVHVLMVIVRY